MPKIAQYGDSRVQTRIARSPDARSQPASNLGTLSKGMRNLAAGVDDMRQRIETTEAEEALVAFEREKNKMFFDPENGYFNNQGRDAYDAAPDTNRALVDLQKRYAEGIKSQGARDMFNKVANRHVTRGNQDIMAHATKGINAWEVATINAQTENTLENAALIWNDPHKMAIQREIGRNSVIEGAKKQGIDGEALNEKLQTYESSFAAAAIEAATVKSAAAGKKLMDDFSDRLEGPDKVKMEKLIARKTKVEETEYTASQGVALASKYVEESENRAEILDRLSTIEDEDIRKTATSHAMYLYNQRRNAEKEKAADAFEIAEEFIAEDGNSEGFKTQHPDLWNDMTPAQRRKIESGELVETDYALYTDLMLSPDLAKVNPAEYRHKLSKSDFNKLVTAVKSARKGSTDHQAGRTRITQTNSITDQLFGKKANRNSKMEKRFNAFHSVLDAETASREQQLGRSLTSEEYTALLSDMSRTVVKEGLIFDSTVDLSDIPADDVEPITQWLRDNNKPVTADNIIKVYEQSK